MTVLDAYALVAYLRGEAAANEVAALLRTPTTLSAANAAEVLDQLTRVYGRDADDVHADLALLANAGMELAPVTADIGLFAGRLRARHYHRQHMAVSLADCIAAATALSEQQSLATADPALAALLRTEGGKIHGLADSSGRLP
ncbi:MAG: PIN domain-containing protein [Micromonosporaceae bacterium]